MVFGTGLWRDMPRSPGTPGLHMGQIAQPDYYLLPTGETRETSVPSNV